MHGNNGEAETVKSPEKIREIYKADFAGRQAFMKYYNNNIPVQCRSYSIGTIVVEFPLLKVIPDPVVIFTYNDRYIITLTLKKTSMLQKDVIQFEITRCALSKSPRHYRRNTIDLKGGNRQVVFITNLITETFINNALIVNHSKIHSIINLAEEKLQKKFMHARISIATELQHDPRMQYIYTNNKGYLLSNIGRHTTRGDAAYDYYMSYIYPAERILKTSVYRISEMLIPLFFKNKIPYGYLRINKENLLSDSEIQYARSLVKSIEDHFCRTGIIPVIREKILINDISQGGFSTLQHQKKKIMLFKNGNQICCDLVLPESGDINILGRIAYNSNTDSGLVKSGLKIEKIDDTDMTQLVRYLNTFSAGIPQGLPGQAGE